MESVRIDAEHRVHARLRDVADADRVMALAVGLGPLRSIGRAKTTLDEVFIGLVDQTEHADRAGDAMEPIHA